MGSRACWCAAAACTAPRWALPSRHDAIQGALSVDVKLSSSCVVMHMMVPSVVMMLHLLSFQGNPSCSARVGVPLWTSCICRRSCAGLSVLQETVFMSTGSAAELFMSDHIEARVPVAGIVTKCVLLALRALFVRFWCT